MTKKDTTFEGGMSITDDENIQVNLTNVDEDGDFPVLTAGSYQAIVDTIDFGMSKSSGNPMWTWRFAITEGEHEKRVLFYHTVFGSSGISRIKKAIMALGVSSLLDKTFDPKDPEVHDQLVGQACTIRVAVGTYQDKPNNNIKSVSAPSSGGASDFV